MLKIHYFVNTTVNECGLLAIVKDSKKVNQLENAKKIHAARTKRGKRVQRMNSHNWFISFFLIAGECGARFEANHCAQKKTEKKKEKGNFLTCQ